MLQFEKVNAFVNLKIVPDVVLEIVCELLHYVLDFVNFFSVPAT